MNTISRVVNFAVFIPHSPQTEQVQNQQGGSTQKRQSTFDDFRPFCHFKPNEGSI